MKEYRREKSTEELLIQEFRRIGFWAHHNSPDGDTGRFDVLACGTGVYCWVEVKREDGELRPEQRVWAVEYLRAGGRNLFYLQRVAPPRGDEMKPFQFYRIGRFSNLGVVEDICVIPTIEKAVAMLLTFII